ncbi:MAG TPA: hypothetical protein VGY48_15280 [Vicinamibacterales bacterium]|jgi:predicted nuclease with TOPRIM domain|nr:hypothetical protein [Vicinamibacterales bacterium]
MSKIDQQKTVWEQEITTLKARVDELQKQRSKLEDELRPHRDRVYKEQQRAENEKRIAERDLQLVDDLMRIEALVKKAVKDPLLWPAGFAHALDVSSMRGFDPLAPFLRWCP